MRLVPPSCPNALADHPGSDRNVCPTPAARTPRVDGRGAFPPLARARRPHRRRRSLRRPRHLAEAQATRSNRSIATEYPPSLPGRRCRFALASGDTDTRPVSFPAFCHRAGPHAYLATRYEPLFLYRGEDELRNAGLRARRLVSPVERGTARVRQDDPPIRTGGSVSSRRSRRAPAALARHLGLDSVVSRRRRPARQQRPSALLREAKLATGSSRNDSTANSGVASGAPSSKSVGHRRADHPRSSLIAFSRVGPKRRRLRAGPAGVSRASFGRSGHRHRCPPGPFPRPSFRSEAFFRRPEDARPIRRRPAGEWSSVFAKSAPASAMTEAAGRLPFAHSSRHRRPREISRLPTSTVIGSRDNVGLFATGGAGGLLASAMGFRSRARGCDRVPAEARRHAFVLSRLYLPPRPTKRRRCRPDFRRDALRAPRSTASRHAPAKASTSAR